MSISVQLMLEIMQMLEEFISWKIVCIEHDLWAR